MLIKNAAGLGRPVSVATKSRLAANGADEDLTEYYGFGGLDLEIADDFDTRGRAGGNLPAHAWMQECRLHSHTGRDQSGKDRSPGGTALWISFPQTAGKGSRSTECWTFIIYRRKRQWLSAMGIMILKCCRQWGHGIAMQNASEELKSVADEICGDVAEDGIYFYCKEKGLI